LLVRQPRRIVFLGGKLLAVSTFMIGAVALATIASIATAFAMAHGRGIPANAWTTLSGLGAMATGFIDVWIALGSVEALAL
jgi:hypothetical protein